jgi:hypothetical protein
MKVLVSACDADGLSGMILMCAGDGLDSVVGLLGEMGVFLIKGETVDLKKIVSISGSGDCRKCKEIITELLNGGKIFSVSGIDDGDFAGGE